MGETIIFGFAVDHMGGYGDIVTNRAACSHASGGASDEATFTVEPAPILLGPLIMSAFAP